VTRPIRILFVHNALTEFVRLDLEELRKHFVVTERFESSRAINLLDLWWQVKEHDLVFGWFSSWHTFLPMEFAKTLGKPSVLVVGGYDVANMPEIGYGHQRGGLKKGISSRALRVATKVITISNYSRAEIARNLGLTNGRAQSIYLGVPDKFGYLPSSPRGRVVLTVGNVNRSNLTRKGHEAFVRAAAFLPGVKFVLAGAWQDSAIDNLRRIATPNVEFTGHISSEVLLDYYRSASVYVQPSLHEGFGLSVAEAMLAGCIPVTTRAGALPEVVGDHGLFVETTEPREIADAIKRALTASADARRLCRGHILDRFPLAERGRQLQQLILSLANGAN
jgi:glycosyltransferase involved in cell wall biosynthesis